MDHIISKKLKLSMDSWTMNISENESTLSENPMLRTTSDFTIGHILSMTPLLRANSLY